MAQPTGTTQQSERQEAREIFLKAGVWVFEDKTFASGKKANNKIDMDRLERSTPGYQRIIEQLGKRVLSYKPNALWGVPVGGQNWARDVASEVELPLVELYRPNERERTRYDYKTPEARALAEEVERMVAIEDVTTEFTSLLGALRLDTLHAKTAAAVVGWRRGIPALELPMPIPVDALVREPIPIMITRTDNFYVKFGHMAIGHPTP